MPEWSKLGYPFKPKRFVVDEKRNLEVSYIDEGEGIPVIMVHGNPTWSFYYRHLLNDLPEYGFRVIAIDHMGCGLSDKPQDYSYNLKQHINNLNALLDYLQIEKFQMIVHDWGGPIGIGTALQRIEQLQKLVILNTAAFTDGFLTSRIKFLKDSRLGEWMIRKLNLFAWPATWMTVTNPLDDEIKRAYLYPYDSFDNRIGVARFVQDIPMDEMHPSWETLKEIEEGLPTIKIPKLILWGKKDFCFTEHFFNRWQEIYPDAQSYLFDDCGHYILEDAHPAIEKIIREFLQ